MALHPGKAWKNKRGQTPAGNTRVAWASREERKIGCQVSGRLRVREGKALWELAVEITSAEA